MENFKSISDKIQEKLDYLGQLKNLKDELIGCRDTLNKLIPPTDNQ